MIFITLPLKPPLWSLANTKCVLADIMRGAADILHGAAIILCSMASIFSNVPEILHVQHQFSKCFGVFKGKNTLFLKMLKNWSSCQKADYHFLGGVGGEGGPSDKNHFVITLPL